MRPFPRSLAPVALLAALHTLAPAGVAWAQPRPAAASAPRRDLVQIGQQQFDDQQYEESIQTLSAALVRPNNTKAQRVEIYRLLALNYITLNRKDESEAAVRGLLSIQPDYELPKAESPRFRDFFANTKQRWEAEGRPGLVKESEPAPAPVTMLHTSPSQVDPGTKIDLSARMQDPEHRVASVKLFYRTGARGSFKELSAFYAKGQAAAHATIPASAVKPPFVEYYLLGYDKNELPVVSRGDVGAPLRVAVPEPSKGWVLPVVIGGVVGAAAIVGGLALAGVFKSSGSDTPKSNVSISIGE
jgi:hypothetical protein